MSNLPNTPVMQYDKSKYRIWSWKHILMLHWMINPGLAFNELVLGQRVPRVMLVERNSSKALDEKTQIPCPHCGVLHSGLKWSLKNNAFKNWFGLYCDHCGKIIPCLFNLTSILILVLSFPIWIGFRSSWKKRWLAQQPDRYSNLDLDKAPNPFAGKGWVRSGINWGFFMFIFNELLLPLAEDHTLRGARVFFGFFLWMIAGLAFGASMKWILVTSPSKKPAKARPS